MSVTNIISLETRYYDLDMNRHVTSRTYENFCQEGRFKLLHGCGYPLVSLIEEKIQILPLATEIRFHNQQFAGAMLDVHTECFQTDEGYIIWEHKILDQMQKLVCNIKLETITLDKNGNPLNLLSPEDINLVVPSLAPIKEFSKSCNRAVNRISTSYSDLNCFGGYYPEMIWKIFEEGRWMFFKNVISLEKIHATDTTAFFMGGMIRFFEMPGPGESLMLYTWIDSVDKIRFYYRQDIVRPNGKVIASMKDEQVFVSMSASRPKKAPVEIFEYIDKYLEHR